MLIWGRGTGSAKFCTKLIYSLRTSLPATLSPTMPGGPARVLGSLYVPNM
jgi:hypothetical protein